MTESDDIIFMKRCLELASRAEGLTYPNPLVGSVIVHDGLIVGEGYHLRAGAPHAEVNAINSVPDRAMLKSSTLYVNLEPCSHFGKTPPCADLIIAESIPRIVIGTLDTSDKVSGKGLARLREAGREVIAGVAEEESRRINRRFFTVHEKRRPYITLKWAQSVDGYLDILRSDKNRTGPNWITGNAERVLVHKWRAEEQSILVGAETIRADNPRLNVRDWRGNDPLKLILSSSGSLDKGLAVFGPDDGVVVFTHNTDGDISNATRVKLNMNEPSSYQIATYLFESGIQSLLIEGGARVLDHFLSTGLWDEARIFTGKDRFNAGVKAPVIKGKLLSVTHFSSSNLEVYLNDGSEG
jgi:diaminohydroxyphosphoribosylaminopyrimidine deaminase/5-amino-6-(5-phosphoribosylamino)uracil reductase